ncbi:SDR family oxidoreductase [Micromonospora chokoriensis]
MHIMGSVALVTGANRGLGRHFVAQLLDRGASKVYATARNPQTVDIPGAHVLPLDITDEQSVAAAAAAAADVTLLVNNAGIATFENLVTGDPAKIRLEMETHFFGTLNVIRAFAPILKATGGGAGGGAIINMLSALSFFSYDGANAYSAAKAAAWSLTNGVRVELLGQRTLVTAAHAGSIDTDMMAGFDIPKLDPAKVISAILDAVEENRLEVLLDADSSRAKAGVAEDPSVFYPQTVIS